MAEPTLPASTDSAKAGAEEWRAVVGYEWLYEVSSHGWVRRSRRDGRSGPGGLLKPRIRKSGHRAVMLYREGKPIEYGVHALVADAFVGPRPAGKQVHHEDGDPAHNRPGNLYYGTAAENAADRDRHGRTARGERAGRSKLTEEQVREIRRLYSEGNASQGALARTYGVASPTICRIISRALWAHVP